MEELKAQIKELFESIGPELSRAGAKKATRDIVEGCLNKTLTLIETALDGTAQFMVDDLVKHKLENRLSSTRNHRRDKLIDGAFAKVQKHISEQMGIDEQKITPESDFKKDLGMDSLDMTELILAIEQEYNIIIRRQDLDELSTVGDFVSYLCFRLQENNSEK